MPTKCVAPHMTWEQRVMQSYAYNAPDTQHALYSANTYATTIRYSLYNAPWLPRRVSDCGRQKRYPANPKPSRSTYAKRVFIRWRGPTAKNKREKCFILYRAKTAYRWSRQMIGQDLNDSNKSQQTIDPIMVSKVTKNGTQDTLSTQKWYKLWPKMVNFGYGWPIMVSKVTKNGTQLVQKTHKLWSKQCKFCKNCTN